MYQRSGTMIDMEIFAVDKVKYTIARSHILQPYLNENDKMPFLDGDIFIYDVDSETNERKSNRKCIGKVVCQVKGENNKALVDGSIKYSKLQRCVCEFYWKLGYDYKVGLKTLDYEGHYRLEKFRDEY